MDKEFYVSPFLEVDGDYRMRLPKPGDRLSVTIALRQNGKHDFHRHHAQAPGRSGSGGCCCAGRSCPSACRR